MGVVAGTDGLAARATPHRELLPAGHNGTRQTMIAQKAVRTASIWPAVLGLLMLLCLPALAAPKGDAGVDAPPGDAALEAEPDAAGDSGPLLSERAEELRSLLPDLHRMATGKPPSDAFVEDLFPFDPRDPKALELGRESLRARISELSARLGSPGGDAGIDAAIASVEADAGDASADSSDASAEGADASSVTLSEVEALELEAAKARLAFLDLPEEQRRVLLDQDAERKRVVLERERANAERENALAEQRKAEEARQKALEAAERAHNEIQRVVANETARMEGARGAQAAYRRQTAERRQAWASEATTRQARVNALTERAMSVSPQSTDADGLYDEVVGELTKIRENVRDALSEYRAVPDAPRYEPDAAYFAIRDKVPGESRAEIESNVRVLARSASELETDARSLAWETLAASVAREHDLNARRIALLQTVTEGKRSAVLGFGPEGIAQLQRELGRLAIEARWYRAHAEVRVRGLRDLVRQPLWIGEVTWSVLLLAAIVAAVMYVRRRGPGALEHVRVGLVRSIRRPAFARPIAGLVALLAAVLPPLALLVGVVVGRRALGDSAATMELAIPLRLLFWFACYRLLIVASHRGIAWLVSGGIGLKGRAGGRSERILRSVRMVARYGFAVALVLIVAAEVLGKGYLFNLVLRFAWLGAVPILALLVRWWRNDIVEAYLSVKPRGRLANLVRSTRERWFGFFVATAAFVVVLGEGIARALRRFVLGFDQTRKAFAFLFRRRLERRAATTALVPTEDALPDDLLACFSEEPVNDEPYAVTQLSGLEEFALQSATCADDRNAAAMLVVGETGFGKTSWLNNAALLAESPRVDRLVLSERLLSRSGLVSYLCKSLGAGSPGALDSLCEEIVGGGPRIVMLDDAHHLLLRGVDTYQAWDALSEVVERTRQRVFWVATMGELAYQHLVWARGGAEPFRRVVRLKAWDEERVSLLINARTRESEYEMVYDDLVVDKLEGVEGEAQLVSTQQGYTRLIWDYADGCPRVALHCWKNSLVPDGEGRMRVRLFRRPVAEELETLSEAERFVLAGVAWHTTLTLSEAERSLKYTKMVCEDALDRLHDSGILMEHEGRYRVTTRWLRPVHRFLLRKHLIEE